MNIIYCADAIVIHKPSNKFILINRLGSMKGLALPGGKRDPEDTFLSETIIREIKEEIGLQFIPEHVLGTYAEAKRDPRGNFVSTVFIGTVTGLPKNEPGKTEVLLLSFDELIERKHELIFDHARILDDYLAIKEKIIYSE